MKLPRMRSIQSLLGGAFQCSCLCNRRELPSYIHQLSSNLKLIFLSHTIPYFSHPLSNCHCIHQDQSLAAFLPHNYTKMKILTKEEEQEHYKYVDTRSSLPMHLLITT